MQIIRTRAWPNSSFIFYEVNLMVVESLSFHSKHTLRICMTQLGALCKMVTNNLIELMR